MSVIVMVCIIVGLSIFVGFCTGGLYYTFKKKDPLADVLFEYIENYSKFKVVLDGEDLIFIHTDIGTIGISFGFSDIYVYYIQEGFKKTIISSQIPRKIVRKVLRLRKYLVYQKVKNLKEKI